MAGPLFRVERLMSLIKHRLASANILAAVLACTAAAPLKAFDRQTVQEEYDYIIARGYLTTPQEHLENRVRISNLEWGCDDVYPLFIKGTTFNPPVDHAAKGFDTSKRTWGPAAYSDGPLKIGFQGHVPAFASALKILIVENYNTGNSTGVKQGTAQVDDKFARGSSYDGYLNEAMYRPNLDVFFYAPPEAKGVAFMDYPTGVVHEIQAKKETIVSASTFDSPQLPIISASIDIVHENVNVGQHLNDHSVFSIMAKSTPEFLTSDMAQEEFYARGTGQYKAPRQISADMLREIGAGLENYDFYPNGPTPCYTPKGDENYISLMASSLVALSRGNVSLQSNSMAVFPVKNIADETQYFANPTDETISIASFKYLRKILAQPCMSQYTVGPNNGEVSPGPNLNNDDAEGIMAYMRQNTVPKCHASGTCRMLPEKDGDDVDPSLKVHGVDGLKVADCSVIPVPPDLNVGATVHMIGEKAAEMIRKDWDNL
ncbi:GMC oxidoreductase [Phyllosticta citriasiana]|uniref:GMC oxidoreductase n=1 Tax=Phyllosticta citriasiana TaxID=595635 RepID=UPI0030FD3F4E